MPEIDEATAALFSVLKKDLGDNLYQGDDLNMGSVAKYCIPSGIPELDVWLGAKGGYPGGKIIEFYGKPMCLAGDTFVNYHVRDETGKVQNAKGGSIEHLYRRFHRKQEGRGAYQRPETERSYFTAPSVREDGTVVHNKVMNVMNNGRKECFEVTTSLGFKIKATAEHKFHIGDKYVKLTDLRVGDELLVHNNTIIGTGDTVQSETSRKGRKYVYVQNHPFARTKLVNSKYEYKVLSKARATLEAYNNDLSLEEYIDRLNKSDDFTGLKFIPKEQHVHHVDEDFSNDDPANLVAMSPSEHIKLHGSSIRFEAVHDKIVSIESVGIHNVYDLKMETPYHNYVANKFVVSNCGKTTAALHAAAECQKRGGTVMFIDTEHSFDPKRAREVGVNPEKVLKVEVETLEDVYETIRTTLEGLKKIDHDAPFLFIVDSVNGTPTKSDLDGDLNTHERVGFEAKQIKRGTRQINTDIKSFDMPPTIIFINHAVTKIGAMAFAKQTDSGGGLGIKFYASVRVEFVGSGWETEKSSKVRIGQKIKIEIIKLKGASVEWPKFEVTLRNDSGFDKVDSLLTAMIATKYASRPAKAKVITLIGRENEEIKTTEWRDWIGNQGGYDKVYTQWREWATSKNIIKPWGS